jgi:hypothetical protein
MVKGSAIQRYCIGYNILLHCFINSSLGPKAEHQGQVKEDHYETHGNSISVYRSGRRTLLGVYQVYIGVLFTRTVPAATGSITFFSTDLSTNLSAHLHQTAAKTFLPIIGRGIAWDGMA